MKKTISLFLLGAMLLPVMTGCRARAEKRTGEAEGYGGKLVVSVSMNGEDITDVTVTEHHETQGVGTRAIDALPGAIVQADSIQVDSVSGATVTSEAIKAAVSQALGMGGVIQNVIPMDNANASQAPAMNVLRGAGMASSGRVGPGKDAEGGQVYSVNVAFAAGEFDPDGVIRAIKVDQLEIVTPNLGGGSAFSGFPSSVGDEDRFLREVSEWTTKGAMGDDYKLASGTWREQMDWYEQQMVGKTVEEVKSWYASLRGGNTSEAQATGAADAGTAQPAHDMADVPAATAAADTESSASIALEGEYGEILLAVERAWIAASAGKE